MHTYMHRNSQILKTAFIVPVTIIVQSKRLSKYTFQTKEYLESVGFSAYQRNSEYKFVPHLMTPVEENLTHHLK